MPLVSGLNVYPVKGMRSISLQESLIEPRGLAGDRRWVVADEDGKFLSQRNTPELATYDAIPYGNHLRIIHAVNGHALVPVRKGPIAKVTIWNDTVDAIDAGHHAALWLTKALEKVARLYYLPDCSVRLAPQEYSSPGDVTSFADAFPILVVNEASLAELNSRLSTPLPIDRFRGNIVISGFEPWAEDDWGKIQIGETTYRAVKDCGRCLVTTTDQRTGERMGDEPLKTLATYRLKGKAVMFGRYIIPDQPGTVKVGDPVTILG